MPGGVTVIYFESFRDNLSLKGISGINQCLLNPDHPHFILNASTPLFKAKSINFHLSSMESWPMRSLLLTVDIGTGFLLWWSFPVVVFQVTCTR